MFIDTVRGIAVISVLSGFCLGLVIKELFL